MHSKMRTGRTQMKVHLDQNPRGCRWKDEHVQDFLGRIPVLAI